jgi:hypothetical protein
MVSLGSVSTEASVLEGTGKCFMGICWGGLALDTLAQIARDKTHRNVTVLRDLSYDAFREHLTRFNDPSRRYIINFHRGFLFGQGHGHHSPIGGYLEPENLVFVLDVNSTFRPWLVEPRRLYDAMNTEDSDGGKKRGMLLIE